MGRDGQDRVRRKGGQRAPDADPETGGRGAFAYDAAEDGVHIGNIRWEDDAQGPVKVYKKPAPGRPYIIGADTAGDGSDWFVGQVLDNVSGEQVAVLRHQYDEDTFSRQMYCLGKWYNDAMLAPEANFSTYPVKLLDLMGYRNLYVREIEDTFDGTIRHAYGFRTDRLTRPGHHLGTDPGDAGASGDRQRRGHSAGDADVCAGREAAGGGGAGCP